MAVMDIYSCSGGTHYTLIGEKPGRLLESYFEADADLASSSAIMPSSACNRSWVVG
jgi:hypothetical protein